ncbi:hypothetical protein KM043_005115 [Ampulex compressa]|nr:hypothetical protein KM043_005115 [Ampulex compressa]
MQIPSVALNVSQTSRPGTVSVSALGTAPSKLPQKSRGTRVKRGASVLLGISGGRREGRIESLDLPQSPISKLAGALAVSAAMQFRWLLPSRGYVTNSAPGKFLRYPRGQDWPSP